MIKDKINTLVVVAYGEPYPKKVLVDTFFRGLLNIPYEGYLEGLTRRQLKENSIIRRMLSNPYEKLSYLQDWLDAISRSEQLKVKICNINNLIEYMVSLKNLRDYDLILLMHSVIGDDCRLIKATARHYLKRKGKIATFIGNEYDLMTAKKELLVSMNSDYICTQLPLTTGKWLYEDIDAASVLPMPHGLNQRKYHDQERFRQFDLGFIGTDYPLWVGDVERKKFLEMMNNYTLKNKIKTDIRIGTGNLTRNEWAKFLNRAKGVIGSESGTYYLDKSGSLIAEAKKMLESEPHLTEEDLYRKIFKMTTKDYRSGKSISSRHFEPIGTKTCQILLEGKYNNLLIPGKHYLSVKKDYSNIEEIIKKFQDEEQRRLIVDEAYNYVREHHTYDIRVKSLVNFIFG